VFTSHLATIALVCGGVVLLMGLVWAARAPRADGRRLVPRKRSDGLVSAILVLDGVALIAVGVVAGLGGDDDPERTPGGRRPWRDGAQRPAAGGGAGRGATLVPRARSEQAAPPRAAQGRGPARARLAGDGLPRTGRRRTAAARCGSPCAPRPSTRASDMAVDDGIAGQRSPGASVFRAATPGAPAHLTLVVPDDKTPRRRRGCAARPPVEALRAVVDAPERFYVQLANEAYPDGAVRGALAPCRTPCRARGAAAAALSALSARGGRPSARAGTPSGG
jgi:hypothetical protein